jgi:hypothetical protein
MGAHLCGVARKTYSELLSPTHYKRATPIEVGKGNNHSDDLKIKKIKGKDRYADWLA